jgi:uncharacterized circularly permuted ATP-grasp superfamily protein/uncharacterized alpha-E superfamily protein
MRQAREVTRPGLDFYRPVAGRFDELIDERGEVRPHWQPFLDTWFGLGPDEVLRRQAVARRMVMAERSAHVAESEPMHGLAEELDSIPYVVSAEAWRVIDRGMVQRSLLLNAVVADLYGERRLVREGIVPASLLFGNVAYQAALTNGVRWLGVGRLTMTAADVVRTAEGDFQVVRDVTDVATGSGYASLYRSVMARVFPSAAKDLAVCSLDPWFALLHSSFAHHNPVGVPSPRTVLLGPDGDDDDAVEASYLATALGFHLSDASDLVVRSGRVWLRALGGLEPVDVLWRRLAERSCDPLELGPSTSGVPGLVQAVRSGSVVVSNAFGSGLVEGRWLHPFLEDACKLLLGESLQLLSLPAYWLGQPDHRAEVLSDLQRFEIFDVTGIRAPQIVAALPEPEIEAWIRLAQNEPDRFVAQRRPEGGTTPTVVGGVLRPVASSLRIQAVRTDQGFSVLPGGVSHQTPAAPGGATALGKDVWIVGGVRSERILRPLSSVAVLPQIDLRSSLPTRSAESLWWLGRNAERAEMSTRFARVLLARNDADPDLAHSTWLEPVLAGLRSVSGGGAAVDGDGSERLAHEVALALGDRAGGLADSLQYLLRSARAGRGFLSATTWKVLNDLARERATLTLALEKDDGFLVSESLDRTLVELTALSGLGIDSMVRGPAWSFLNIGRALERALQSINLFDQTLTVESTEAEPLYGTVLAAAESLVAYRRRYRSDLRLDAVIDMLVHDVSNPRSVIFQLDRVANSFASLPPSSHRVDHAARVAQIRTLLSSPEDHLSVTFSAARTALVHLIGEFAGAWFTQSFTQELSTTR